MAFDSPLFLFGFLPLVLLIVLLLQRAGQIRSAMAAIAAASIVFYGWHRPAFLALLLGSIAFNFLCGRALIRRRNRGILAFGITVDVLLLGFFKYLGFFTGSLQAAGLAVPVLSVVLPLGISFYTFSQIAFLVDTYRGETKDLRPLPYLLFASFFPNVLAGPIAHYGEMAPQFSQPRKGTITRDVAVGLTVLIIGLSKKVLLADTVGPYADTVFTAAAGGTVPLFADAWMGALAYSFQLYFDFSGYSDMAIGIARMLGIRLPLNFSAPYRSSSIREFWRRWHITLSRFLMTYLYIPLGGSRRGEIRTLINLFLTMLIGGLWHGAGWTFVLWGAWHGALLVAHRLWLLLAQRPFLRFSARPVRFFAVPLTFLLITMGWVLFRAETVTSAAVVLKSMIGLAGTGFSFTESVLPSPHAWKRCLEILGGLAVIVWFAPTTQTFVREILPRGEEGKRDPYTVPLVWKPRAWYALCCTVIALASVTALFLAQDHVFIYFQF